MEDACAPVLDMAADPYVSASALREAADSLSQEDRAALTTRVDSKGMSVLHLVCANPSVSVELIRAAAELVSPDMPAKRCTHPEVGAGFDFSLDFQGFLIKSV